MKRRLLLITAALILFSGLVEADVFDDAMAAYGRGDFAQAADLLQSIAEKGNSTAQFNLGQMYEQGEGVDQNYQKAVKWYQRSASVGNGAAQYRLGQMYEQGRGINQDFVRAHMWYDLAAAQGLNVAKSNRDYLAQQMTPDQIAKAHTLARECKMSNYKNCD